VNPINEFIIQFSGLSDGTHKFEFEINIFKRYIQKNLALNINQNVEYILN
jgi:hypothetical protein